jgi:hypothetical protein
MSARITEATIRVDNNWSELLFLAHFQSNIISYQITLHSNSFKAAAGFLGRGLYLIKYIFVSALLIIRNRW